MTTAAFAKEMDKFHYVTLCIDELTDFAKERQIQFDQRKLEKEINLLKSIQRPLDEHLVGFQQNWTFERMNEFTKTVKRIFTNRRFKASDANNLTFYYSEHEQKVHFMLKANTGLSETSRLTLLKNMYNHLEYLQKGINVKSYFQLRSYIEKFGHEETPAVLKRKKMDLTNIYKRVDNRPHIDEVLSYEANLKKIDKSFQSA